MNGRRYRLTAELQSTICEHIRGGVTPYIAAEACGIPRRVYEQWIKYSQARRPTKAYRAFGAAVMQAQAQAAAWAQRAVVKLAAAGRFGAETELNATCNEPASKRG